MSQVRNALSHSSFIQQISDSQPTKDCRTSMNSLFATYIISGRQQPQQYLKELEVLATDMIGPHPSEATYRIKKHSFLEIEKSI